MFEKTEKGAPRRTFSRVIALASTLFIFAAFAPQIVTPAHAAVPTFDTTVRVFDGGSSRIRVTFDQGVSGTSGGSSALDADDFIMAGSDNLVIQEVVHEAGDNYAIIYTDSPFTIEGPGEVTLACAPNAIFDENTADACDDAIILDINDSNVDAVAPTVTDGSISIEGASGINGAFIAGDVVKVIWNNNLDNNPIEELGSQADITADFSAFGGGSTVTMTDDEACDSVADNNVYGACFEIVAGNIDAVDQNVSVTVVDNLFNDSGVIADTSNATVDNELPIINTIGSLDITNDKLTLGKAEIADFVTYVEGTATVPDTDTWAVNLTTLTGTAAATATGSPYQVIAGDLNDLSAEFTETLTDNAGNTDTGNTEGLNVNNLAPNGGGGGGGNGGVDPVVNPDNAETDENAEEIDIITEDKSMNGPLEVQDENVTDNDDGTVTVKITGDATLTLKPNEDATVWMMLPEFTSVTADDAWDQTLNPPLVRATTMIAEAGEKIKGTTTLLKRADVNTLVEVESNVALKYDKMLTLSVPLDYADGTKFKVYTSDANVDPTEWVLKGTMEVKDKAIKVMTDSPSMFAFVKEAVVVTPEEDPVDEEEEEPLPPKDDTFVSPFTDIAGHWAADYINELAEMKIVSGKTATMFDPNAQITRCELTKIVVNAFDVPMNPVVTEKPFNDIAITDWCAPYAAAAKAAGIVEGVGGNMFEPLRSINRAEAVAIFIRAGDFGEPTTPSAFSDVKDEWFAKYIRRADELNIVSGYDGTKMFGPADPMTRGEASKVTVETMNNL